MTKRMLIDAAHANETRVVLMDDDLVYDYDFVTSSKNQIKGNIYLAKITRVEPSLQAAFVEYGGGKQGFLPFSEIHPDYYQLPQDDKQKLLEEQIAEAEAEEAAEDEAFEREQAAREARGYRPRDAESGDDFNAEEEDSSGRNSHESGFSAPVSEVFEELSGALSDEAYGSQAEMGAQPLVQESFVVRSDDETAEPEGTAHFADGVEGGEAIAQVAHTPEDAEDAEEAEEKSRDRGRDRGAVGRRYRIQEVIKRNQIVLVQAIKEERGNKGASLTTFISLAGRAAVLMPNSPKGGGISRKITDRETRRRLKEVAAEMRTHRGMSVIIRTAGIDRTQDEIRRDYEYLVSVWNEVRELTLASTAPALIYEEGNLIKRSLRDLYTSDVAEVIVEGEETFQEAQSFMRMLMPNHVDRVKRHTETMPLYAYAGVEDQLSGMTEPQVRLPSGGYIVIHPTEALISIDVNSGRSTTERNVEETAIKTNLEAAYEVARQLRLRDLAGLIVIDFIDMGYSKNRKQVERAMKDALRADRAKIQIGRISMFGLMELSRQRLRPSISESMGILCPHCKGTGYIHSVETVGIQIIRMLEKEAAGKEYTTLRVTTHPEVALYLLNEKRAALQALEQRYSVTVVILMDATLVSSTSRLVKVTADGREVLHDPSIQQRRQQQQRGRRGRRGGRDGGFSPFESNNVTDAIVEETPRLVDEPQSADENAENRGGKRERGGRNRRRGGARRPSVDGSVPADYPEETAELSGDVAIAPEGEGNGTEAGARERNRRRGRRGGRNRRGEAGERVMTQDGSVVPEHSSESEAEEVVYATPKPSYSTTSVYVESTPEYAKPSFVIPLSEAQTNPEAVASAIISESTGSSGDEKRKGWWTRVLEG